MKIKYDLVFLLNLWWPITPQEPRIEQNFQYKSCRFWRKLQTFYGEDWSKIQLWSCKILFRLCNMDSISALGLVYFVLLPIETSFRIQNATMPSSQFKLMTAYTNSICKFKYNMNLCRQDSRRCLIVLSDSS